MQHVYIQNIPNQMKACYENDLYDFHNAYLFINSRL
jgi:hypothetical protein